jgi:hypothetical protein
MTYGIMLKQMPNRNYVNGRNYEYKCMRTLEAEGYATIRTAGSHGFADVIGFKLGVPVRCIQIKRTKSPSQLRRLLSQFKPEHIDNPSDTYESWVHELWVWHDAKWHTAS